MKQQYSQAILIDVLKGKNIKKIKENGLNKLSVFGLMKKVTDKEIRLLIDELLIGEYLEQDKNNALALLPKAITALKEKEPIYIIKKEEH